MLSQHMNRGAFTLEVTVDFAEKLATKGSALATSDVFEVLTIPAGTVVSCAGVHQVEVANSTTLTLDIGDGTNADMYVDGFDAKATDDGVPIMTVAKYYPTADTIDVDIATLTGTLSTGKVKVWALCFNVA